MIYLSAGHCNTQGPNYDPGAPGMNGRYEANETMILRNAIVAELKRKAVVNIICDIDSENRHQYLSRIKPGNGSVVVELHFNAGPSTATGTEALIAVNADKADKDLAGEFAQTTAAILGIKNRGVKSEASTRHKRLGLMRKTGIVTLIEVCFITNAMDMKAYDTNFEKLVRHYAEILIRYDSFTG